MTSRQRIATLIIGGIILLIIVELIRRRKLREEYSWLWLLTGVVMFLMVVWYDFTLFVTRLIGAVLPTTAIFLLGLLFLVAVNIHFSAKISELTMQVKNLAQELAIMRTEAEEVSRTETSATEQGTVDPKRCLTGKAVDR